LTGLSAQEGLPALYGAKLDGTSIAVDVRSSGCTDASYFSVQLEPDAADLYRLSIKAQKQDRCRVAPYIVTVVLDLPVLATSPAAKFLLLNKLEPLGSLRRAAP